MLVVFAFFAFFFFACLGVPPPPPPHTHTHTLSSSVYAVISSCMYEFNNPPSLLKAICRVFYAHKRSSSQSVPYTHTSTYTYSHERVLFPTLSEIIHLNFLLLVYNLSKGTHASGFLFLFYSPYCLYLIDLSPLTHLYHCLCLCINVRLYPPSFSLTISFFLSLFLSLPSLSLSFVYDNNY